MLRRAASLVTAGSKQPHGSLPPASPLVSGVDHLYLPNTPALLAVSPRLPLRLVVPHDCMALAAAHHTHNSTERVSARPHLQLEPNAAATTPPPRPGIVLMSNRVECSVPAAPTPLCSLSLSLSRSILALHTRRDTSHTAHARMHTHTHPLTLSPSLSLCARNRVETHQPAAAM